jgi:endonuclease YncB( thermonuclease family)
VLGAVVLAAAMAGCTSSSGPAYPRDTEVISQPSGIVMPDPSVTNDPRLSRPDLNSTTATLVRWVDGDTAVTSEGRVRLLGMDTPERGQCGFGPASSYAARLAPPGSTIELVAVPGDDDKDRFGRLLRYVEVGTTDVGYELIRAGYAIARYDSRDGYGPHPRERDYIAADASAPHHSCR